MKHYAKYRYKGLRYYVDVFFQILKLAVLYLVEKQGLSINVDIC